MPTLSRLGADWSHELIKTANDQPQLINDGITISMI